METNASRRRFVRLLADWAMAPPTDRQARRALNDPLEEFYGWARRLANKYYFTSLDTLWGATRIEFIDACIEKVFEWARTNTEQLMQPEFTDNRLEGWIRVVARNLRVDFQRDIKRAALRNIDTTAPSGDPARSSGENTTGTTSEGLADEPRGRWFFHRDGLQREFALADRILPRFGNSIRSEAKMRHLLSKILRRGRRYSKRRLFPAHWYALRILKKRRTHLPPKLRRYLSNCYPGVDYAVINARLGCLRREFAGFCIQ